MARTAPLRRKERAADTERDVLRLVLPQLSLFREDLPVWAWHPEAWGGTWHVAKTVHEAACGAHLEPTDAAFWMDEPASNRVCSECLRRLGRD